MDVETGKTSQRNLEKDVRLSSPEAWISETKNEEYYYWYFNDTFEVCVGNRISLLKKKKNIPMLLSISTVFPSIFKKTLYFTYGRDIVPYDKSLLLFAVTPLYLKIMS